MALVDKYDQQYNYQHGKEDSHTAWETNFPNYRVVTFPYKAPCTIPKRLDNIYCQLNKEDRQYNNFARRCHKENIPLELKPPVNMKEQTRHLSNQPCFEEYHFSVIGKNTSETCAIPTDRISLNQCYCDVSFRNAHNNLMKKQCFCQLKVYESTNIPVLWQSKYYYIRQDCFFEYRYNLRNSKLLYCTIQDEFFYFESMYFDISHYQDYGNTDYICSQTNALNSAVPKNILLPTLFLVFYIFRYLGLVGKKLLKNKIVDL